MKGEDTAVPSGAESIGAIVRQGIAAIVNPALRDALETAYESVAAVQAVAAATRVFERLSSTQWPRDILCRFLAGWRAMHGTALFVSGLIVRLQREARQAKEGTRAILYEAAAEVGEIIPEDTGVTDRPHHELFAAFANLVAGDDAWKLDRLCRGGVRPIPSLSQESTASCPD